MNLFKIITELQAEKHRLDEAIEALERLAAVKISRRGRPPKSLKQEKDRELGTASSKARKSTRTRVENL